MNRMRFPILLLLLASALHGRAQECRTYRVQPEDTLLRLSWKYSVSPDAIREVNHLRSDRLPVGRDILLPVVSPRAEPVAKPEPIPKAERVALPEPVAIRTISPPLAPIAPVEPRPATSDVRERLLSAARELAARHIGYNEPWTPPGQRTPWRMDCSNTARYLYETAEGIDLGRTASDQYDFLCKRRRAWPVPMDSQRLARIDKLQSLLKAGDLLFWENTYRPDRPSPITHVMIFLGEDENGRWIMAGSRGHHAGGPDIYPFDPHQPAGGYSIFFGLIHHTGRFVAFGRPVS